MKDIIDYIDWDKLCTDNDLIHGDLPLHDQINLEEILNNFINTNK
jgi:hypothetical protein